MSDTPKKITKANTRYSSPCPVRATGSTRSPQLKGSLRMAKKKKKGVTFVLRPTCGR
jgi:hypothetical protein